MPWLISVVVIAVSVIAYALGRKGDVSASMSICRILEFKLDAKEKRKPDSQVPIAKGQ
jgi:hypothetical protein